MPVCPGDISGYGKPLRCADKLRACYDLPVPACAPRKFILGVSEQRSELVAYHIQA
jgi:hypothetical protein